MGLTDGYGGKMAAKPHLNLVFIGHVDHGKSTTVGRILFDTGHVDAHVLEGFKKEAGRRGKGAGAVLLVGAAEGVQAQTKEHIFLARTLGVTQLIVAINKMDASKPPYAEASFDEIKTEVTGLLKAVGY